MTDDAPDLADRRGMETSVYEPAEDSALLAEAAVTAVESGDLVYEVGVGSGWVSARVAEATGARVVGGDVNPDACRAARACDVEAVRADLVAPFRDDAFDVVLFNPPYLPTDPEHEWDDWMETALSGGASGRAVVDPFLDDVGRVLAPAGVALLLVSTFTDPEAVTDRAAANGLAAEPVRRESYPFETLTVYRLTPT